MKPPEEVAGEACTQMHRRFSGSDWTKELPVHIRVMLGNNEWGTPLWRKRAMPPNGKIFELDRFEDYLMKPFREGLGFTSWWTLHSALETQGFDGAQAIKLVKAEVSDYDAKVDFDHRRNLQAANPARNPHGGARPIRNENEQGYIVSLEDTKSEQRGNSAAHIVALLKRDHPEIAQQLAHGEFKSARAAGIAAGIVRVPTPLDLLRKDWKKATAKQRKIFLAEISSND